MRPSPRNPVWLVLPLLLLAAPAPGAPGDREVGRVITQTGEVAAIGADGQRRDLSRRDRVFEGDTLVTGDPGRAQIRFKDAGLTDLRPGTRFKVERYRAGEATGDPEKSVALRLIKGGLRTITGVVGREHKKRYRLHTPVANIGIRGTQYQVNFCQSDCGGGAPGLYGGVAEGAIGVSNQGGNRAFGREQYFYVASAGQAPKGLLAPPPGVLGRFGGAGSSGAETGEAGTGEGDGAAEAGDGSRRGLLSAIGSEQDGQGRGAGLTAGEFEVGEADTERLVAISLEDSEALTAPPPADPLLWGAAHLSAGDGSVGYTGIGDPDYGSTIAVDDQEVVQALTIHDADGTAILDFVAHSGASPAEDGRDEGLGVFWGRWSDGDFSVDYDAATVPGYLNSAGDFHYAYGTDPTSEAGLGGLGGTATYSWSAGTLPTGVDGQTGALDTFSLAVDFEQQAITSALVQATVGNNTLTGEYDLQQGVGSATFGPEFSISLATGGQDCGGCGQVKGAFVGGSAQGALVLYHLSGYSYQDDIVGAGLLQQDN